MTRAETLEQEKRWAVPVAVASLAVVGLTVGSLFVNGAGGDSAGEVLRSIDEHSGSVALATAMRAVGFGLLVFPLLYLFRAARVRSEQMRSQLIGLVIAAPLFLALSTGFTIVAQQEAADEFVAGNVKPSITKQEANEDCVDEREDDGTDSLVDEYEPAKGQSPLRACEDRKREDDAAREARTEASLAPLATGFGLAGALGLVVSFFYTCLWAMRTGLLTRFWGSLGMAVGIATVINLIYFLFAWLIYFALLLIGKVPGGKPPAWQSGEAEPWPTPGSRAAADMEPKEDWDESELEGDEPGDKRKRKQRE